MKIIQLLLITCSLFLFAGCDKDVPQDQVNDNERQILWASAEEQIGATKMPPQGSLNNTIEITVNGTLDLTSVKLEIAISPGASISPSADIPQDFSNGPVTYIVTSASGQTREFQIKLVPFTEILQGTWRMALTPTHLTLSTFPLTKPPKLFDAMIENYGTAPDVDIWAGPGYEVENDNAWTFNFEELNANGQPAGTLTVDPGPDGKTINHDIILEKMVALALAPAGGTSATPVHYPNDFSYIPSEPNMHWARDVVTNELFFSTSAGVTKARVRIDSDTKVTLMFDNPNLADQYVRLHNGWGDRYDFTYYVYYTLTKD